MRFYEKRLQNEKRKKPKPELLHLMFGQKKMSLLMGQRDYSYRGGRKSRSAFSG